MTKQLLDDILSDHSLWLMGSGGERANLQDANLKGANLQEANLRSANLRGAYLRSANLRGAYLRSANLRSADLWGADLQGANLTSTVLDPENKPNADVEGFQIDGEYVIGYRSKSSPIVGGPGYEVGKTYKAPVFSTCTTECHPGLYLCPIMDSYFKQNWPAPYIKVRAKICDVHKAGNKWRCKEFTVIKRH